MKIKITFLLLFANLVFFAQNYIPIDTADRAKREVFLKIYEGANKIYVEDLMNKYSGRVGKEVKKNLEEFSKDFSKEIKEGKFLFNDKISIKVNEIVANLQQNNPSIPKNIRALVAKNGTLNAYCMSDGTFVVNLGLFYWMQNEDQIAGILAHEFARKILEHSLNSLVESVKDENSDATKEKVRAIKNQEYNRSETAFSLFKNRIYKKGQEKRKRELEADSLGYVLMKNSKYNKLEFLEALKLAVKYDSLKPKGLTDGNYKKYFDLPKLPFNEKWLEKEDFSGYNYNLYKDKLDKDSLASHPEALERIGKLKKDFPELNQEYTPKEGDESYKSFEKIAEYELIPNLYFNEDYGVGVYISLLQLQNEKDEKFYKEWLGKCFKKIYEARKAYTLNRYLERVDPKEQSESYQQFLSFMWNLSLDDIKEISEFYTSK